VSILPVIIAAIAIPCFLYILWRVRWGHPPAAFPKVLAYHKVTGFEFGGTWTTPRRFETMMDALTDDGFHFIDEETFLKTVEGERRGSEREILVTFDDGYAGLLESAIPALDARGIPALIFLVTAYVGGENRWELYWPGRRFKHLGWDEIKDLASRGFRFGSHSATHRDLTSLAPEEVITELAGSKLAIEERLGRPVHSLSYPFGRTDPSVMKAAGETGYRAAFSLYPPFSNAPVRRFALRREGIYIIDGIGNLKAKLAPGGMFWVEDLKGRAINAVALLTPAIKKAEKGFRGDS